MQCLGAGSHGCCLAVQDTLTGEVFCLKVPRPTNQGLFEHSALEREFRILRKFNHYNVVRAMVWVDSCDGNIHGFMMPRACGNLWHFAQEGKLITRGDRVSLSVQVARGLSHVHAAGVVHLDMKPENLLTECVAGRHLAMVADFGQSKLGPRKGQRDVRVACDAVNSSLYRPLHLM